MNMDSNYIAFQTEGTHDTDRLIDANAHRIRSIQVATRKREDKTS